MDYVCILLLAIYERDTYVLHFYRRERVEERVISCKVEKYRVVTP